MLVRFMAGDERVMILEVAGVQRVDDQVQVGTEGVARISPNEVRLVGCPLERWDGTGILDLIPYQREREDDGSITGELTSWHGGFGFVSGDNGETYFLHLSGCGELLRCKLAAEKERCFPKLRIKFWDTGASEGDGRYSAVEMAEEVP